MDNRAVTAAVNLMGDADQLAVNFRGNKDSHKLIHDGLNKHRDYRIKGDSAMSAEIGSGIQQQHESTQPHSMINRHAKPGNLNDNRKTSSSSLLLSSSSSISSSKQTDIQAISTNMKTLNVNECNNHCNDINNESLKTAFNKNSSTIIGNNSNSIANNNSSNNTSNSNQSGVIYNYMQNCSRAGYMKMINKNIANTSTASTFSNQLLLQANQQTNNNSPQHNNGRNYEHLNSNSFQQGAVAYDIQKQSLKISGHPGDATNSSGLMTTMDIKMSTQLNNTSAIPNSSKFYTQNTSLKSNSASTVTTTTISKSIQSSSTNGSSICTDCYLKTISNGGQASMCANCLANMNELSQQNAIALASFSRTTIIEIRKNLFYTGGADQIYTFIKDIYKRNQMVICDISDTLYQTQMMKIFKIYKKYV